MTRLTLTVLFAGALLSGCAKNADDAFVQHVRALAPSVVLLTMKVPPAHKADRYDIGYASGTVVATGAWGSDILTVQHAIEDAWDVAITVNNKQRFPAKVVASDPDLDVALVRTPHSGLPTVSLGSSAALQNEIGRELGLLGYPIPDDFEHDGLGLATSLNTGRLSSVRKDALEVMLPIVPGESGGPIFFADTGEIIGIADSRFDDERSIGFAVPVDDAKSFLHKTDAAHGF